jgi:hypothetical protein
MTTFAIIETDEGMRVVELSPGQSAEDAAIVHGGNLIDSGPYVSYEEAYDAMFDMDMEDED